MPEDLELIEQQLVTLYRYDAAGSLVAVNYPGSGDPPRLAIGRTLRGMIWRFRHDVPPATRATIDHLLASESLPRDLREPPRSLVALREVLATDAPVTSQWFGPAWAIPASLAPPPGITPVAITDGADVAATFPDLVADVASQQPFFAVRADGAVVAACFSSRLSPVAAEAGVNTLETYRGRGYAAAVVAAWADAVRRRGLQPLYSTSWDNLASQGVARKLGLVLYGADLSLT